MIAACLLLLVFFSVALGNTWWEVVTCGELSMVFSHSPTIWQFLGTAVGLLLATAVPVLLVLRAFVWNRINRIYWILCFILLLPSFWVYLYDPLQSSEAQFFTAGAVSLVLVPLLTLPARSGEYHYPRFKQAVDFGLGLLILIGLAILTPNYTVLLESPEEPALSKGMRGVQLALNELHKQNGEFPLPEEVEGGNANDSLSKVSSFPGYPNNQISHQNFYCGPFWYQRESPDFLDLELLPPAELKRWKELANYGDEGPQKSVNIAPIYYEVMERFEEKKRAGEEIPEDLVHPFSGHFLYLVNRDRTQAALVPFRPGYTESNDYMSPRFLMRSDGNPDGIEIVFTLPSSAPISKNWDRQLYYDPPGPTEAENSQESSGAEGD